LDCSRDLRNFVVKTVPNQSTTNRYEPDFDLSPMSCTLQGPDVGWERFVGDDHDDAPGGQLSVTKLGVRIATGLLGSSAHLAAAAGQISADTSTTLTLILRRN